MGPFPFSFGFLYILVAVDYISKWVEAIPCWKNDHKSVIKFLKENILSRFGIPWAIISDGGKYFCNKPFESLIKNMGLHIKFLPPIALRQMVKLNWQIEKLSRFWKK